MPFLNFKNLFSSSAKPHKPEAPSPVIGLDIVGRGIALKPHQAYELKNVLFKRTKWNRIFHPMAGGKNYCVPDGYEVNENFLLPANHALSRIVIEESWEHFDKRFNIDAHVAASNKVFTVEFSVEVGTGSGQTKKWHPEEDSYYAVRTYFIPCWTLYLPDVTVFSDEKEFKLNIPTPFLHKHRREYEKFFERYGTHYIKKAWIGGKAMLTFTIAKSKRMTKKEFLKALNTCHAPTNGSTAPSLQESLEILQNNSECMVLAQGGESAKLGALSLLDDARYNDWLATVRENPKVVEFDAVGIWTLISDEKKAKALWEAYKAATIFTPFSAVFSYDGEKIYFIRGKQCTCYHIEKGKTGEPKLITELWPALSEINGFETVEAALNGTDLSLGDGESLHSKLFFFKGNKCVRLDIETEQIDEGYPKSIAEQWPGVTFDRIDATLSVDSESVYFFRGDQYIRYNIIEKKVYSYLRPNRTYSSLRPIRDLWSGITFDRIDAAMAWRDGMAYFFRENEYIRCDTVKHRAEGEEPKFLVGNYIEDWHLFD